MWLKSFLTDYLALCNMQQFLSVYLAASLSTLRTSHQQGQSALQQGIVWQAGAYIPGGLLLITLCWRLHVRSVHAKNLHRMDHTPNAPITACQFF